MHGKWKSALLSLICFSSVWVYVTYFISVDGPRITPVSPIAVETENRKFNLPVIDDGLSVTNGTKTSLNVVSTDNRTPDPISKDPFSIINGTKTILMTRSASSYWGMRFPQGRYGFINIGCDVSNCFLTTNHTYVKNYDFDAFLIHVPTERKDLWQLPSRRQDQIFVFFSTEPPVHVPQLDKFENYFNWTMTYRSNSDIHLPYGWIEPLPTAPETEGERSVMREQVIRSGVNPARGKTKLALWMVSNCNPSSNRFEYVKLLQKYVPVDIISSKGSKCGGVDLCPRKMNEAVCYEMMERHYKFYLSFENAICDEYVSEKFFNAIGRNIVPIVLGGADYASIAPEHSYINAMDFTPHQLADYLNVLDRNDSLYAEYFWWKPHYRVVNLQQANNKAFCNLCARLHANPMKKKIATGLQKWYHGDSHCKFRPKFNST